MKTESKLEPEKMEPVTDLEQPKSTEKDAESILCNSQSRLRYVLMIIAAVFVIAIITLGFYLGNKFK
jgi:hypothetical protein